jgi:hypothetical protein
MYDTSGAYSVCNASPTDNDIAVRIAWLKGEVVRAEDRDALRRVEAEMRRTLSIIKPVSVEAAYAKFGAYLGLFPPVAIFYRILSSRGFNDGAALFFGTLFFAMGLICYGTGWKFGGYIGRKMGDPRSRHWPEHVFYSISLGFLWALVTGGLGGVIGFGLGAVVGILCALPVALAAFPVFAVLHRIQSHGGMIEERDLRTIAVGIPLTAAALILSVGQ